MPFASTAGPQLFGMASSVEFGWDMGASQSATPVRYICSIPALTDADGLSLG